MRGTDVAFAIKALGTSALPHPSVLDNRVRKAVRSARQHLGLRPGVLTREQRMSETVMDALGDTGGVTIALPYTAAEQAARDRHPALATPYVRDACKRLRDRPGVAKDWDWQPWDPTAADHHIEIRLAREQGGRPLADGGVDRPGFTVTVWLASDWAGKVHANGHAVIDGWFVLDTGHQDMHGRPTSALVLDLLPENDRWARDDDGHLLEDDWQYRERFALIDWSGGAPKIAPEREPGA